MLKKINTPPTVAAVEVLFSPHAKECFDTALRYVARLGVHNVEHVRSVHLTFGGCAAYGRSLAAYNRGAHTIVVPTGNKNQRVATLRGEATDARESLEEVLIHELMHAADRHTGTGDAHSSDDWCHLTAQMLFIETNLQVEGSFLQQAYEHANRAPRTAKACRAIAQVLRRAMPTTVKRITDALIADAHAEIDAGILRTTCMCCGAPMEAQRSTKLFCSPACRTAHGRANPTDESPAEKAQKAQAKKNKRVAALRAERDALDASDAAALQRYEDHLKQTKEQRVAIDAALQQLEHRAIR